MWSQYSINIFIYAYRSDQYRGAYWDLLVRICPYLETLRQNVVQTEAYQTFKKRRHRVHKTIKLKMNMTEATLHDTTFTYNGMEFCVVHSNPLYLPRLFFILFSLIDCTRLHAIHWQYIFNIKYCILYALDLCQSFLRRRDVQLAMDMEESSPLIDTSTIILRVPPSNLLLRAQP